MNTWENSGHREICLPEVWREMWYRASPPPPRPHQECEVQGSPGQVLVLMRLRETKREWKTPVGSPGGTLRKAPKYLPKGRRGIMRKQAGVLYVSMKTVPDMCPTWRAAASPAPTGTGGWGSLVGMARMWTLLPLAPGLTAAPVVPAERAARPDFPRSRVREA